MLLSGPEPLTLKLLKPFKPSFIFFVMGTDTEKSDIDLLVEFNRPIGLRFINLVDYLEDLLGRKVDVVTRDGLENIRVKKVAEDIHRTVIYV